MGTKILLETKCPEERPVAGRVIVDAFAFYSSNNIVKPHLTPLEADDAGKQVREKNDSAADTEQEDSDEDAGSDTGSSDSDNDAACDMKAVKPSGTGLRRVEYLQPLTDEQCLLATPWLKGLDLKSKDWAMFNVDDLSDIVWNDDAFENLVLPGNEKDLAWAFVENKCLSNNQFDDFVADKGRGIIIL